MQTNGKIIHQDCEDNRVHVFHLVGGWRHYFNLVTQQIIVIYVDLINEKVEPLRTVVERMSYYEHRYGRGEEGSLLNYICTVW